LPQLVVLIVLAVPPLAAQGLGDASAREKKKRDAQPPAAKVFTNGDLRKDEPPPAAPAAAGTPGAVEPAATAADGEPKEAGEAGKLPAADGSDPQAPVDPLERERQERRLLEAEWRMRFANAREQLALAEAACWREVVRTEFYQGIPVQMKVKEFVETEEFRRAKQALADLEEEFRRTGLPPGWAREP
jgi:hypothetical protein